MSTNQPYASGEHEKYVPGFPKKTFAAFLVFCLCMALAGYRYYRSEEERYTNDKSHELSAIVSLKKGQIETWRNERLSDANFIFFNDEIAKNAQMELAHAGTGGRQPAAPEWMESMFKNQHYSAIAMVDRQHRQVLAFPDVRLAASPAFDSLLDRAAAERHVLFSDFYRDANTNPALSIIIPLLARTPRPADCLALVVLQIDPIATLYPLIQSWPIPSTSGELLLLRSQDSSITYLNTLRFSTAPHVMFTVSAQDTSLLVAKAYGAGGGTVFGLDYRGAEAIGVAKPVDNTPWMLIAKSDADEIYAPLVQTGIFLRVIGVLIFLIGVISIVSVWRHRRGMYYRRSYLQELERKSLVRQIEYLVKYANDIIIVADDGLTIVDANDKAVEAYGYLREELLGMSVEDLRPGKHRGLEHRYAQLILDQGSALYEAEHLRKDGTSVYVEVSGRIIEIEAKKYFQSIIRDITQRKRTEMALRESEERFRMLVESLDEIVYTLGADHRILSLYGSWVERSGFDAAQFIGKTIEHLYGPTGYNYHRQMEERALQGEHVLYDSTYVDASTQSLHDVQTSLSPLCDASGVIIGIVGIGRDITKVKRLERDLLQSQKMDSLGKLAGGIAHDFNNLLAMLMGSAELLHRNLKDDPLNAVHIQRILEATDRGASIAKRLLLFSRQGGGQFQPVSISHILNEVGEMLRYSFPKTMTIAVNIQVTNGIVNGDAGLLHQAFVNLCLNAKDAMGDHGTMTLTERTVDAAELREKHPKAPAGRYVAVSIADTGSGIDEPIRARIFEPFFTTKESGKGTGLGLSIVDGIVRNHHGFIDVQSEPGSGTTFTLYFPAYTGPVEQEAVEQTELLGSGEKILVVDDEALLRDLLTEYLRDSGYTVVAAGDAEEALAIYDREGSTIDIVITDLGMPHMSGEELFARLRAKNPSIMVIISSGYLDGTTRDQLTAKGVADVLTKPYRLAEIQKTLFARLSELKGKT